MAGTIGNRNSEKGKIVRSVIKQRLAERALLAVIVDAMLDKAADGDLQAAKEIFDRVDGKAAQSLELSGDSDNPIVSEIQVKLIKPSNDTGS